MLFKGFSNCQRCAISPVAEGQVSTKSRKLLHNVDPTMLSRKMQWCPTKTVQGADRGLVFNQTPHHVAVSTLRCVVQRAEAPFVATVDVCFSPNEQLSHLATGHLMQRRALIVARACHGVCSRLD